MDTAVVGQAALAKEINEQHDLAFGAARKSLEHARRAGELLLQAKTNLEFGYWIPWVRDNCRFSIRTAQVYLRIFQRWDELQAINATAAHLGLRQALAYLAPVTDGMEDVDVTARKSMSPGRTISVAVTKLPPVAVHYVHRVMTTQLARPAVDGEKDAGCNFDAPYVPRTEVVAVARVIERVDTPGTCFIAMEALANKVFPTLDGQGRLGLIGRIQILAERLKQRHDAMTKLESATKATPPPGATPKVGGGSQSNEPTAPNNTEKKTAPTVH